jgi:hypothetical protein
MNFTSYVAFLKTQCKALKPQRPGGRVRPRQKGQVFLFWKPGELAKVFITSRGEPLVIANVDQEIG